MFFCILMISMISLSSQSKAIQILNKILVVTLSPLLSFDIEA